MRILQFTSGSATTYSGSCLQDNAHAAELIRQGHEVTLVPLFAPARTDEIAVSQKRVFFGSVSLRLQQSSSLFRTTPRFLDRIWDAPFALRSTPAWPASPHERGKLAVAILEGETGILKKEFDKLIDWLLRRDLRPDLIILPSTLLIALAEPLRNSLGSAPVCCRLQGEDLFLEGLAEPWRSESLNLIRRQVLGVDRFCSSSDFYARLMSSYLDIPKNKIDVHPVGLNLEGLEPRTDPPGANKPFTIGYFARIAPEKGLHIVAEAVSILRREFGNLQLAAAGSLPPEQRDYLDECHRIAKFDYLGELTRPQKADFLRMVDIHCVPSPYADPKGLVALESMAVGTPVACPAHGAFPELIASTGGGVLYARADARDVAAALGELIRHPARLVELGRQGAAGVRRFYSIEASTQRACETYAAVCQESAR